MNLLEKIKNKISKIAQSKFSLENAPDFSFELNTDKDNQFGDISTNIAMILAKQVKKNPREVAAIISSEHIEFVEKIEIAGPGFINLFLSKKAFENLVQELHTQKEDFFKNKTNQKYNYNIEFVSANPTGPIHLGNGRGGIIGDVLATVLKFLNNQVTKEYYINDAGNQINKLGMSFKIRCEQQLGKNIELPEDAYHGEYLIEMAQELIKAKGEQVIKNNEEYFADYAKNEIIKYLKETLSMYGIEYDVWFSEKSLHTSGDIKKSIQYLSKQGYTFEADGALWFKSTMFGDDKDRVLIKSDGEFTYTAADIAYMQNKIERGANYMIMTLGHDHHSFAQRLHGLHQAIGLKEYPLDVILYQLVNMKFGNEQVKMSKRSGNAVTLREVIETVGKDVARFFYLNKNADSQLEFDLELALKQNDENPVFYIQYALVRAKGILRKCTQEGYNPNYKKLNNLSENENNLIKKIITLKEILSAIEKTHQTYLLANFTLELSSLFHKYYNQNRILGLDNKEEIESKLCIVQEFVNTLELCLKLMGLSTPEKM